MTDRPMDATALAGSKSLSLTTFRKDGTPVATPVWLARHGNDLVAITPRSSGKAQRLRNSDQVLLAPCDMRGRVRGEGVEGTARLQDDPDTATTITLIKQRYGLLARLSFWWEDRNTRDDPVGDHVGIVITVSRTH